MDYFWRRSIIDCSFDCRSADEQNHESDAQCKQIGDGCLNPERGLAYVRECGVYFEPPQSEDYGPSVTSCEVYDWLLDEYHFEDCFEEADPNENELFGKPSSVTTTLSSIGVKRFNMSVTWEHPDAEHQASLSGYRVTIQKVNSMDATEIPVGCLCVRNISQRHIDIPYMPLLQYGFNTEDILRVTVSTFPRAENRDFDHGRYSKQYTTKWPENCLMINHTEQDCSAPQYEQPTNVKAVLRLSPGENESHPYWNTKQLDISWNPPPNTSDLYSTPRIYYITLLGTNTSNGTDIERIHFQTNNTQRVSILGLDSSDDIRYGLNVQAYKECTGIKYLHTISLATKACGELSFLPEIVPHAELTTSTTPDITTPETPPSETLETEPTSLSSEAAIAGSVAGVIVVVIMIIITSFVVFRLKKSCKKPKPDPNSILNLSLPSPDPSLNSPPPPYCYVVVIYPLDTPLNEKIFMQSVLCPLQDYVDNVVFIDNHRCGTGVVALSWEEELRKATNVLFACTPKFCTDWVSRGDDGSQNSQLFNFLKATLAADIANNQANKYAAVVFNKTQKIPNQNFLSSIKRVVVDSQNIDDLQFFVTKVPHIVCTDISNGVHNKITHHRLASSPNQSNTEKRYDYTQSSSSSSKEDESCSSTDEECSQYSNQYIA